MRNIIAICKRELLSSFVSPVAYFVITGFTLLSGYFFFNGLAGFVKVLEFQRMGMFRGGMPSLNQIVVESLYHVMLVVLVFLVPLLTMRTIAEEKRRGTFELLITSPVSITQIVIGKFLGLLVLVLVMLSLMLLFPMLLVMFGNPEVPPIFSGFFGVVLCTVAFTSIGMAASSFTENQIVAGVSSMVTLLLLYVIQAPAESIGGTTAEVLKYLSPVEQVNDMIRGIVTLKSVVYFLSLTFIGLFVSQRALEAYRWR